MAFAILTTPADLGAVRPYVSLFACADLTVCIFACADLTVCLFACADLIVCLLACADRLSIRRGGVQPGAVAFAILTTSADLGAVRPYYPITINYYQLLSITIRSLSITINEYQSHSNYYQF